MQWLFRSRRRAIAVVVVVLLALDAGRSIYARVGERQPTERWEPPLTQYSRLTWPPSTNVPPGASQGQRIYIEHCSVCHGLDGRGNGPASPDLIPRPRDFTLGLYKYKSTPAGELPTDEDLYRAIANGLTASAMPYWHDFLQPDEIRAVAAYVKGLAPAATQHSAAPITIPRRTPPDSASIARGRKLYASVGCTSCHGTDGRLQMRVQDATQHTVYARDLTAPWTFRGGDTPEAIWLRLTTGLLPSPMPAFAELTTPAERWDIVNYVLSLRRTPPWEPGGQFGGPGASSDPVKRGEYLAHAEMCALCHTQIDTLGIYREDDRWLAGGMRVGAYPQGVFVSRNLTSDSATGLGAFSAEQIAAAIRNGHGLRGYTLNPFGMPWMFLHGLTQEDATAIGAFLKTLSPIQHHIPAPLHYGIVETIVQKVAAGLPAASPTVLTYADADYADAAGQPPRDRPQRLLITLQWIVLIVGIIVVILAGPRERRWPSSAQGWIATLGIVLSLIVLWLIGFFVNGTPALSFIPPEQVTKAFVSGVYQPDTTRLASPEARALVRRGRYLFTVASCALCHEPNGSGGFKISVSSMFGTTFARNLTSDSATGIGAWSDAELERAIRSGVLRDGRQMHWQAMIWDMASNWDEEDLRSIIAFLRQLPLVHHEIPNATPPGPNDCRIYTFWIRPDLRPGCQ